MFDMAWAETRMVEGFLFRRFHYGGLGGEPGEADRFEDRLGVGRGFSQHLDLLAFQLQGNQAHRAERRQRWSYPVSWRVNR